MENDKMQYEFKEKISPNGSDYNPEAFKPEEKYGMAHLFEARREVSEHWNRVIKIQFSNDGTFIEIINESKTKPEMNDYSTFFLSNEVNSLLGNTFLDYRGVK